MTGEATIVKLENSEPIEGADKIVKANAMGETLIVSKEHIGKLVFCLIVKHNFHMNFVEKTIFTEIVY